jgi:hypothetical protein
MSDKTLKYPRGTCLVFTTGEYSDYGLRGILVTIKECDLPALAQLFAQAEKEKAIKEKLGWFNLNIGDFPSWLVANGYAMPADAETVHLGNYNKFEYEFDVPDSVYEIDD